MIVFIWVLQIQFKFNHQLPLNWVKKYKCKDVEIAGWRTGAYWLAYASAEQKKILESTFGSKVTERWSEILYTPELLITFHARNNRRIGKLDARLSNDNGLFRRFARQHSFQCRKE